MIRILSCLLFFLLIAETAFASEAKEPQASDYTLSMAGALVNDHCGRNWQDNDYISIFACNYHLANSYSLDISTQHFGECAVAARGDIVIIADCMVERFNTWLVQPQPDENVAR